MSYETHARQTRQVAVVRSTEGVVADPTATGRSSRDKKPADAPPQAKVN